MSDIEREAFEQEFPVPKDVEWCGNGYAPTKYSADQGYNRMWKVWQAARQAPASGEVEPVAWATKQSNGRLITASTDRNAELEWSENYIGATVIPLYTHPPAKVPEGLIDAVQNLGPFEKDFGANFNDEFGVYHCNYCNARYEQDLCEKPELDHAEDCPVVKLRELLTTPTPAATPETEWVKCSDQMPPDRKAVIVWCYASGCCGYAHYSYEKGEWLMPEPQPAGYNHISHWMHFPTPPQEQ